MTKDPFYFCFCTLNVHKFKCLASKKLCSLDQFHCLPLDYVSFKGNRKHFKQSNASIFQFGKTKTKLIYLSNTIPFLLLNELEIKKKFAKMFHINLRNILKNWKILAKNWNWNAFSDRLFFIVRLYKQLSIWKLFYKSGNFGR